ncbi:hypothetical protein M422DRAFT_174554 [Sphaerobolus stellatus SS14]|uniref:Copper transport protein n=1 Tax=Sphaerobolus stellatus (strain SS14) TaxID=990650 RepID=A0A0C9VET7_SPHS4|nr:hypothetical protein M422DRAFT_174554 [Sphaerobolus stellatus SS14]
MDHGGGMGGKCSMNMLWNRDIIDTCIVFPEWHIRTNTQFVLSFLVIVALGVFYEYLREYQRIYDVKVARTLARGASAVSGPSDAIGDSEDSPLLTDYVGLKERKVAYSVRVPATLRIVRASFYGTTIFLSFFLMLVFMTYNAYLIAAVVLGAGIGHYIYGGQMDPEAVLAGSGGAKSMACH